MSDQPSQPSSQEPVHAVALRYVPGEAPKISASGSGETARQIVQLAQDYGVPLYEHPELAEILARLDLEEEIPATLYRVIAEILAFAFQLQGKAPSAE